jgi:hypothetical protein
MEFPFRDIENNPKNQYIKRLPECQKIQVLFQSSYKLSDFSGKIREKIITPHPASR